jgi:hypothetical protein
MPMTQPQRRIKNAEREVIRFRDDVIQQDWKQQHDALSEDCWAWEDLIAKANFLFDRIMDVDTDIQEYVLTNHLEYDAALQEKLRSLTEDWLNISIQLIPHVERLEQEYGEVEGGHKLRENLSEANGILTDDRDFFGGEDLARMRDEAIDAHRAGRTELRSYGGPHA